MGLPSTSQSGDSQTSPARRPSLRLSTYRQSLTGALATVSQKRLMAATGPSMGGTRVSSPGQLGGGGGGSGGGGGGSGGGGSGGGGESPSSTAPGSSPLYGEMPRLPAVSESGDKPMPRPPPSVMLRRASTLASMNVGHPPRESVGASPKERERDRDSPLGGENVYALKKERNALRMDKNVLLLNKRRLETLLAKLLEQPLPGEELGLSESGEDGRTRTSGEGGGGAPALRASSTRAQLMKALDESTGLEKQLQGGGGGGAAAFEAEVARSLDVTAKMAEMKAEHEIAISRLEGELSYRRTQATAATAALQKQLTEAQEELSRARQQLAGVDAQVRESTQQSAELRKQVHNLNNMLTEKSKQLAETRDMLGMDKSTMATVIEMLKDQLRDASADRAAKNRLITELEYAVVHRDALLAEAHDRMHQAAAQAAAAAAAGVSSSAAVARVAASMQSLESKSSWGMRTGRGHTRGPSRVSGPGNGPLGGGGGSGTLGAVGSMQRATRGSMSDEDNYSGEVFEPADMMD